MAIVILLRDSEDLNPFPLPKDPEATVNLLYENESIAFDARIVDLTNLN